MAGRAEITSFRGNGVRAVCTVFGVFSGASVHHSIVYIITMCRGQTHRYRASGGASTSAGCITDSPPGVQGGLAPLPPQVSC